MGGFNLLEHPADVGIEARGDSLEEAMAWLAAGMFSLIVDPATVRPTDSRHVSVTSRDRVSSVVDWLNELLYQYETTGFLLSHCQVSLGPGGRLEAECRGEPLDPHRHHVLTVVKAATYHQLVVSQTHQWYIRVILDV